MPKWCTCDAATLLLILLDDFFSFCTFLASHPLHLAYLFFFLPYLVQLLSFLSPLFLSTSLLLLLLLTVSPYLDEAPPVPPPEFLGKTCSIVLDILRDRLHFNGRTNVFEQFALMILSPIDDATPSRQFGEFFKENSCDHEAEDMPAEHIVHNSGTGSQGMATEAEEKNGEAEHAKGMLITRSMSNITTQTTRDEAVESFQRYGSARKEKEWKRTLACKLYEERMTYKLCKERKAAEGDEEMDLLWEAYEAHASEIKSCRKKEKKKKAKRIELEEEEEEEEEPVGQLCCLQALRLSAGKMNLGMGKRNLMKISKALKGMRMFTGSSSSKK